jgi:hypothetical protein
MRHGVLGPVRRRLARQGVAHGFTLEKPVEPFHLLVASIGIRDGVDQHHQVLADAPNHRLIGNGQTVGEFENRFGGPGFIRMQRRIEVIEGTRARDQAFRGCGIGDSRICERGIGRLQGIQIPDPLIIGDRQQNDVAALLGAANGKYSNSRGCGGQCAAVGIGLGGVDELSGRAGNSSEEGARRRDGGGCRKVGNPGREKTRFSGGFGDLLYGTGLRAVGSDRRLRDGAARRRNGRRSHGNANHQQLSVRHEPPLWQPRIRWSLLCCAIEKTKERVAVMLESTGACRCDMEF